jgi:hypothetical protein
VGGGEGGGGGGVQLMCQVWRTGGAELTATRVKSVHIVVHHHELVRNSVTRAIDINIGLCVSGVRIKKVGAKGCELGRGLR